MWLLVCCLHKEVYLQIFKCVSFWLHGCCGEWEGGPVNQVNHTIWVAVVTPTDRPKSVRYCCLIKLFCGDVCVVTLPFWHFCWCRGFCHRTGSDLLLFVVMLLTDHPLYWLIVNMYCLKVLVQKTSYLTHCNVPHEWIVFLHCDLLAYCVNYNFPTSNCRYVFSISKYSKIKSLKKNVNNSRAGCSGKLEGRYLSFVWTITPFRLYLALI